MLIFSGAARLVRDNITNQMSDAVESRAAIINNYVVDAEEYMTAFALADEVQDLLLDPKNPILLERVQRYTVDFAGVKGIFEGLYIAYIAMPDTHVLTHTAPGAIGITTLPWGLPQTLPADHIGAAVFADQLMNSLLDLELEGLPNCTYIFLNAENGMYLYHADKTLLNTVTTNPDCLDMIRRKLNKLLGNVANVSRQVTAEAEQLSAGAQMLAQGTTHQAETVQELAATVEKIPGHVCENAQRVHQASTQAGETGKGFSISTTAEESTIASRELSRQAQSLKRLIAQFKL